ncbi:MAG: hypothetical protein KKH52_02520 [Nanoarchaeota archaeon]|nr:hypothetical protein [Nanoarchaeota archaeon]MBU1974247.1 hypothetical protein [Nanoarchaeota archaeon]
MYKIPLPDLKEKIILSGKISAIDLDTKIKTKINELSGLISEEGAAHIIANELGINLIPKAEKMKIKELYAGMKDISTVGKITRIFEMREFQKNDRSGKVCSLILGDETGTMRLVLWNDQVDQVKELSENMTILVKSAYVRENNNAKEIHLGQQGELIPNPEGETITNVRESASTFQRKKIQELSDNQENIEIMGTIVQVFDPRFFYTCPRCRARVNDNQCAEHGPVEPETGYVLNLVLDDGSGTIRTVFWKNQIHHLLQKEEADLLTFKDNPPEFESLKTDLLGEQYKLRGRVKKNDMFERVEFSVQFVEKANPEEEIKQLEQ